MTIGTYLARRSYGFVRLESHSGTASFTVFSNGDYYEVKNLKPAFSRVDPDTKLDLTTSDRPRFQLRLKRLAGSTTIEDHCEVFVLEAFAKATELTFGELFMRYLDHRGLSNEEPTNQTYYEALKFFTAAWSRQAQIVNG